MSQLRWGHINVNVRDLEQSVAFYERLGFEVFMPGIPYLGLRADHAGTMDEAGARALGLAPAPRGRACIMQLGDGFPKLDLTELDAGTAPPPSGSGGLGLVRLCLASGDLAADHARLREAGVEFVSPPQTDHRGLADVAVCRDPDGTLIELIQIHPGRWAALATESG